MFSYTIFFAIAFTVASFFTLSGQHVHSPYVTTLKREIVTNRQDLLFNTPLCIEEQQFIKNRRLVKRVSLQKLFQTNAPLPPVTIGLCWSGGGSRSLLAGAGFLLGLKELNILGASSYISSLSGGSHGLLAWLLSRQPVDLFANKAATVQERGLRLLTYPGPLAKMINRMINNTLLKPFDPQFNKKTILDLTSLTNPLFHPYPFFTFISRFGHKTKEHYHWFSVSPHEVRIHSPNDTTYSMLPHYLGSQFNNGHVVQKKDTLSLAGLSLFASAILPEKLAPSIYNPFYRLKEYPYAQKKKCVIRDAGWHYNLPLLPLLLPQRNINLIIILDAGKEAVEDLELALKDLAGRYKIAQWSAKIEREAYEKPIIFIPAPSPDGVSILYASIAPDEYVKNDDGTLYDPRDLKKEPHHKTTNFKYSRENAHRLISRMYQTVVKRKGIFMHAIKEAMTRSSHRAR